MAQLPAEIPIFPLPNVVLFPQTDLPLHIFEPRYREMVADAMAGEVIRQNIEGMLRWAHG